MPKKDEKKRSVTIQVPQDDWDDLRAFAFLSGHTVKADGNVSWAVNQAILFWKENRAEYNAWYADKITKALKNKIGKDNG